MLLIVSLLVFAALAMVLHELGHLAAARYCRIAASEVGLGMGPTLFAVRIGSVRLTFRLLPIGSFVMLDSAALKERSVRAQLLVHLGGIIFNVVAGLLAYGTMFGWLNLLLAAGNILPLYQHDGWKCGVLIVRTLLPGYSRPVERAFTFSGGFVSLVVAWVMLRMFV